MSLMLSLCAVLFPMKCLGLNWVTFLRVFLPIFVYYERLSFCIVCCLPVLFWGRNVGFDCISSWSLLIFLRFINPSLRVPIFLLSVNPSLAVLVGCFAITGFSLQQLASSSAQCLVAQRACEGSISRASRRVCWLPLNCCLVWHSWNNLKRPIISIL